MNLTGHSGCVTMRKSISNSILTLTMPPPALIGLIPKSACLIVAWLIYASPVSLT